MSYEDIKDQMNDLSSPRTPQDDEGRILSVIAEAQPADIVNPISQQEPVAYRHSKTGQLYDSEEEVPLADGDEWAEPLYAAPVAQQEPSAWRQWSTKQHDWDYQTNRGELRQGRAVMCWCRLSRRRRYLMRLLLARCSRKTGTATKDRAN